MNFTFSKLETQNQRVISNTKTVLRISKKLLETGAFSYKQFGENCRDCNFFAITLNYEDIQLILKQF